MRRFIALAFVGILAFGTGSPARADDDKDAKAILEKAIKALGGEEKLAKVKAVTWKVKGKFSRNGEENEFTSQSAAQGLDHFRQEFEGEFNGNKVKGVTVLNGDKGWRKFGDNDSELDNDAVANAKRNLYLQMIPTTLVPLKGNGFKIEGADEEKVADKPAVAMTVTPADGKEFKLFFDKASGLPVKQVARVAGFGGGGQEFTQETTFSDYKDFGGIKKATKIESKRDGQKFMDQEITEFKVVDKLDPGTFSQPQ